MEWNKHIFFIGVLALLIFLLFSQGDVDAQPPDSVGQWSGVMNWPIVAVHMILLPTAKVLCTPYSGFEVIQWDPATDSIEFMPNFRTNVFCSGHASLPNGKTFIAGGSFVGEVAYNHANLFDPFTETWDRASDMTYSRFYPTCTTLPDGRILTMAGLQDTLGTNASIPEIYDMITDTWIELPNAQIDLPLYPFMFLLPDGDVFAAGPSPFSFSLNLSTESWSFVDFSPYFAGSAVMYESGKFLKSGGDTISVGISEAVNWTQVIDMNEPSPAWRGVDSMAYSRRNHNLTVLPDGKVLVTGGTVLYDTVTFAVFAAELWDPSTEIWTTMAGMAEPRMYHSSALLLPDGRVFSAGGDGYPTAEIFSPPYLFKGARPTVTSVPSPIDYGDTIFVETPDGPDISSVSLIRPSAVTHAFNQDQRFMSLTFSQTAGGLNVVTPANANLAPPGYNMLFLVNFNGVPSIAEFVHLGGIPPVFVEAVASDESIPINGIDDDDVVLIRFDKPMNKPPIDALNINNILMLSNGHSWLDGFGDIGGAVWNPLGDMLAITLSTQFGLPTVAVGDSITPDGVTITDLLGNPANSPIEITGSFDPPLGVEERGDLLPKNFALFQNSPNPFSRGTAIHFSLSKKSHTHLTIYDVAGKAVATLVDEDLMAGYHSILWNAPVSSGVYFYRIKAGDFVSTRKMVLLR